MLEVRNSEAAHLAATTKGLIQRTVSPPPPKYLALLSRALWRQTMASDGVGTRCLLSTFLNSSEFEIEVIMAVNMLSLVFWVVRLCGLVYRY